MMLFPLMFSMGVEMVRVAGGELGWFDIVGGEEGRCLGG